MTVHRISKQSDAEESGIQPVRTRQFVSSAAEVHNRRDDSSTQHEVHGHRLLLTVSEAAQQLGIGRSLLYELLADGQVESIHVGRLRRIPSTPSPTTSTGSAATRENLPIEPNSLIRKLVVRARKLRQP